jgi:hypothetical protein
VNKSFAFLGRAIEIDRLCSLYAFRKHVLIVGPAGIGKTALLRQVREKFPLLICEDTSSLRRICANIERQLGWTHYKLNVTERKNRLLAHLERRGEPVAFDHVALTPPRVARFMALLAEKIPIWIACRSDRAHEIGHMWEHLYKFTRLEIAPFAAEDTGQFIMEAIAEGNIQPDARKHLDELHRMSEGNPRVLEELLMELASREYKMDGLCGLDLLDLDRRIHEIDLAIKTAAEEFKR